MQQEQLSKHTWVRVEVTNPSNPGDAKPLSKSDALCGGLVGYQLRHLPGFFFFGLIIIFLALPRMTIDWLDWQTTNRRSDRS